MGPVDLAGLRLGNGFQSTSKGRLKMNSLSQMQVSALQPRSLSTGCLALEFQRKCNSTRHSQWAGRHAFDTPEGYPRYHAAAKTFFDGYAIQQAPVPADDHKKVRLLATQLGQLESKISKGAQRKEQLLE